MQKIIRVKEFDAGHRVMNEKFQCHNLHGHRYRAELEFSFDESQDIGYPIDFKEIKRLGCSFIDEYFDHAFIANPADEEVLKVCYANKWKAWGMSLLEDYCNPTVENLAKEIFLIMENLFVNDPYIEISRIILYETPNCYTICTRSSIKESERVHFNSVNLKLIQEFRQQKGRIEYDDRK